MYYNGFSSNAFIPNSGVPQGATLNPSLFNIYTNDLLQLLDCKVSAYANILRFLVPLRKLSSEKFVHFVHFVSWCISNRLHLKILSFSKCTFNYSVGNVENFRMTHFFDLDALFDSRLSFNLHISNLSASASKFLGFVAQSCRFFNNVTL